MSAFHLVTQVDTSIVVVLSSLLVEYENETKMRCLLCRFVLLNGKYSVNRYARRTLFLCTLCFRDLIKAMSLSTLDEPKNRRICNLKVVVIVGDCDSPAFVTESRQYVQVNRVGYRMWASLESKIITGSRIILENYQHSRQRGVSSASGYRPLRYRGKSSGSEPRSGQIDTEMFSVGH